MKTKSKKKIILTGLGLAAASGLAAGLVVVNTEHAKTKSSLATAQRQNDPNQGSTTKTTYSQDEYDSMSRAISAVGFGEGSPLYNLAYSLNTGTGRTPGQIRDSIIADNVGAYRPKLIDDLHKKDDENPNGWILPLTGYDWGRSNLNALDAFKYFKNINSLQIRIDDPTPGRTLVPYDISSLQDVGWISLLSKIYQVEISAASPITDVDYQTNKIIFDQVTTFNDLPYLNQVNLSNFLLSDNTPVIAGSLVNSTFFSNQNAGFEVWMPSVFTEDPGTEATIDKSVTNITKFKKTTGAEISDPTDSANADIQIDNKRIVAKYYQSNWYWGLDDVNLLAQVGYRNIVNSNDYLTDDAYNALPSGEQVRFEPISQRNDVYDARFNNSFFDKLSPAPQAENITSANLNYATSNYQVDNVDHKYLVIDSQFVPESDTTLVKYRAVDELGKVSYFTSFDRIPIDLRNNNLASVGVMTALPSAVEKPQLVLAPEGYGAKLTYDNVQIESFLHDGQFEWNFKAFNTLAKPKYYSPSAKLILSDFKFITNWNNVPSDINVINFVDQTNVLEPPLKNGYQIDLTNYKDLEKTITVDNKTMKTTLRNGLIYFDDSSHDANDPNSVPEYSSIRYFHADPDGKRVYYSSFDNLRTDYPTLAGAYEMTPGVFTRIPQRFNFELPTFLDALSNNSAISIEPFGQIAAVIREGQIYWDTSSLTKTDGSPINLSEIKYFDPDLQRYYLEIPTTFIPTHLTETNISTNLDRTVPSPTPATLLGRTFDVRQGDNYKFIKNESVRYDGVQVDFVIMDSKIVFKQRFTAPRFIYEYDDQTADDAMFISTASKINSSWIPRVSEVVRATNVPYLDDGSHLVSDLPNLVDPTGPDQSVIVKYYDQQDQTIVTQTVKSILYDGKYYWDNPKYLLNMKYLIASQDGTSFYTDTLDKSLLQDASGNVSATRVDSLNEVTVSKLITQSQVVYEYKPVENYTMIAVVSAIAGVIILSIPSFFIWNKWIKGRRK